MELTVRQRLSFSVRARLLAAAALVGMALVLDSSPPGLLAGASPDAELKAAKERIVVQTEEAAATRLEAQLEAEEKAREQAEAEAEVPPSVFGSRHPSTCGW